MNCRNVENHMQSLRERLVLRLDFDCAAHLHDLNESQALSRDVKNWDACGRRHLAVFEMAVSFGERTLQCRTYSGSASPWGCWRRALPTSACAITHKGHANMNIDLWLAAITAAGLLIYLVAVLVRPERF